MTHRIERIESTLQRAVSEVLQRRIADPRIEGVVSITRVKVSPDLSDAYVYVSVLPESKQRQVLRGLQHAGGHIRTLVGKTVALRTMPRLDFRLDESLKTQAEVYDAIRRGMDRTGPEPDDPDVADHQAPPGSPGPSPEPPREPPDSTR